MTDDVTIQETGAVVPPEPERSVNLPAVPMESRTVENAYPRNEDHSTDRYYDGTWNGYPNYGCPHCIFHTLAGPAAIDEHIYDWHPEKMDFGEVLSGDNV